MGASHHANTDWLVRASDVCPAIACSLCSKEDGMISAYRFPARVTSRPAVLCTSCPMAGAKE